MKIYLPTWIPTQPQDTTADFFVDEEGGELRIYTPVLIGSCKVSTTLASGSMCLHSLSDILSLASCSISFKELSFNSAPESFKSLYVIIVSS